MPPHDRQHTHVLREKQVELLYQQSPVGVFASMTVMLIFFGVLWPVASRPILLTWLVLMSVTAVFRFGLTYRYRKSPDRTQRAEYWLGWFLVGTFVSGMIWGLAIIFLVPSDSPLHLGFAILCVSSLTAGTVGAYSAVKGGFFAFSLPALLPGALYLSSTGDGVMLALGLALFLFLGFSSLNALRTHDTVVQSLKLQLENTQLTRQATHDDLTGLVNRREFEQRLKRILEKAQADETGYALCYLDLDQFKIVNDTCGHVAGDQLLRELAALLQPRIRRRDTLARLGGDEFGVLMEHCSLKDALRVAETLRSAVHDFQFIWDGKGFNIGVSMGLIPITSNAGSVTDVLKAADAACYAAKDKGRNRIHVYHKDSNELAKWSGEMQWVTRISHALEDDRFRLYCQPIVTVNGVQNQRLHCELLIRLEDEEGSFVMPSVFVPAAERYGLNGRLDRWVIEKTIEFLSSDPAHLEQLDLCAINISGLTLSEREFLEFVERQFEQSNVPPSKICFEITETAVISNFDNAVRFITALKERGCLFALDDFGSGLSSFAYLKRLPVDFLKIDGMFIRDILKDPDVADMVRSINDIGHIMGKRTIAEFVSNDAILEKIREIGVDHAQGDVVGQTRPIEEILKGVPGKLLV